MANVYGYGTLSTEILNYFWPLKSGGTDPPVKTSLMVSRDSVPARKLLLAEQPRLLLSS